MMAPQSFTAVEGQLFCHFKTESAATTGDQRHTPCAAAKHLGISGIGHPKCLENSEKQRSNIKNLVNWKFQGVFERFGR